MAYSRSLIKGEDINDLLDTTVKVIQGGKSHLLLTPVGVIGSARNSLLGTPQARPHRCVTQWPPPHPSHVVWGGGSALLDWGSTLNNTGLVSERGRGTTVAVGHAALRKLCMYLGQVS